MRFFSVYEYAISTPQRDYPEAVCFIPCLALPIMASAGNQADCIPVKLNAFKREKAGGPTAHQPCPCSANGAKQNAGLT
jgi:hypothetical protein